MTPGIQSLLDDRRVRLDYETLKLVAKETGCTVRDLLALAPQNDPFYAGTPTGRAQAEWFADIWRRAGYFSGVHLRRMHYWCVSQAGLTQHNGKPYENTEEAWKELCQASKQARYLGLVSIADIADHKNPDPHLFARYQQGRQASFEIDVPELSDPSVWINGRFESGRFVSGFNPAMVQPYHLEVWVEKSTMDDVLLPVCEEHCANLVTGEGEMSITAVHGLSQRLREANKPARIFYISDFDPAGQSMPRAVSRKIEWMVQGTGLDAKLCPLVLTATQVREYDLPRTPIKETERRGARFEERHGAGAVELDALEALHPGELASIVSEALGEFWDEDAAKQAREKEAALRLAIERQVKAITVRYKEQIAALESMRQELKELAIPDLADYEPAPGDVDPVADECLPWLLDSTRDYFEQIEAYKAAQGEAAPSRGDVDHSAPGDGE
jgi:hypothetical protein